MARNLFKSKNLPFLSKMGLFPKTKLFNSSLFTLGKLNLKIQFFYNKNDRSFFFVSFFSRSLMGKKIGKKGTTVFVEFQIEFSQRKKV
jgi:hypothetical protein